MKRLLAIVVLSVMFLAAGLFALHAETQDELSLEQIETMRQLEPRSSSVWNAYIGLQEHAIENQFAQRPKVVETAMRMYRRWPNNLNELKATIPEASTRGMKNYFTSGMLGREELAQLDAATAGWMKEKTAAIDREVQLALADIELSRNATAKMVILAYNRHQKRQAMGNAVAAIADTLFDRLRRQGDTPGADGPKGKADRLSQPTSSLNSGLSDKLATK